MKSVIKTLTILILAVSSLPAQASSDSAGFFQEFAGTNKKGDISIDLYNSLGSTTDIRIGAFSGEIMIDAAVNPTAHGVGYKHRINKNMAVYGMLYLNTGGATSITNITGGFSYTGQSGTFMYNGNAEIHSCTTCVGGGGGTLMDAKGAGFFKLNPNGFGGNMMIGGEVSLRLSPSPTSTSLYAGARWLPKPNVLIDLGFFTSLPAGGGATTSTFGTPAFARVELTL